MLRKASLIAALAAAGLEQGPATPSARDHLHFRGSLTATVLVAGASDSVAPRCRVVAIEWRPIGGAASYQVQVRVGAGGAWAAVRGDPRCGGGHAVTRTSFQDRVIRPAERRFYRVVALAPDGSTVDVTGTVPVDVR